MMSPKKIVRWQELKAKTKNGRTVAEQDEFEALDVEHRSDELTVKKLTWKAELGELFMRSMMPYQESDKKPFRDIVNKYLTDKSRPFSGSDILTYADAWVKKTAPHQPKQKKTGSVAPVQHDNEANSQDPRVKMMPFDDQNRHPQN